MDSNQFESSEEFDLAVFDPPFQNWDTVSDHINAKIKVCFTNFQNRHHVQELFGLPKFEMIWSFQDGRWISHYLPRLCHEHILIYGEIETEAYTGEYIQDRTPVKKGKQAIGKDKYDEDRVYIPRERKILNSVMSVPRNVNKDLGVWSKPIDLCLPIIEWLTKAGDTIFDPFAGSGTFAVVADKLSLNYVGCEIESEFFQVARKRILNDTAQLELFK